MTEPTAIREIDVRRAKLAVKLAKKLGETPSERIVRLAAATPTSKD